jgi:hypothetical protein
MTSHRPTLHHLSTLTLPAHVQNDDLAQRFKSEKYVVKMSRSGLSLLIGWLTEGSSGEGTGAGIGFSGETGKRGRSATLGVVNNHLRFDGKYARIFCENVFLFIVNQQSPRRALLQLHRIRGRSLQDCCPL